jgi:hypothetical protein
MKLSADQQAERWRAEQYRADRQLAPVLTRYTDVGSGKDFRVEFNNYGGSMAAPMVEGEDNQDILIDRTFTPAQTRMAGTVVIPFGDEKNREFTLTYIDQAGTKQRLRVVWWTRPGSTLSSVPLGRVE